jgi:hypothetical protein
MSNNLLTSKFYGWLSPEAQDLILTLTQNGYDIDLAFEVAERVIGQEYFYDTSEVSDE